MKRFMLKVILIAIVMFISVLFGMQQANEGIHKMKGYEDANLKSAFTMKENTDGEIQASVLGRNISSHDLQSKKEQLEEMKAYNFFSSMGKNLANGITSLTEKTFNSLTKNNGKDENDQN
ncbi:YqxA family protein [Bacillus sp. 03113]|uniref:YqxA family protein n=1 Tax=Bacillus sp. 03113 TaxID=2578211 RepID=UPI0011416F02|nr:YqxA family protein [Bacillus sp. 03113]